MQSILLIIILSSISYSAEEKRCSENKNLLTTNLLSLVPTTNFSFFGIEYQRKIDCNSSVGGEISIPLAGNRGVTGYRVGSEYRFYLLGSALEKLYLSPRLLYTNLNDSVEDEIFQVVTLGLAIAWNFQGKHFSANLGFGLDYNTGPSLQETELRENDSNTTPHLRLALGWSW